MPVSKKDSGLSETEFVERFWERVWDDSEFPASVAEDIERREEFKVVSPYLSKLPSGSRILDGGCGLGNWTLYYASKGFDAVGMDISSVTIEKLQERFQHGKFVTGDIRGTEFKDDHFDAYFSWGAFEHFEDGLGAPLREAQRILKPGGYLFISVPFQNTRHLLRDSRALRCWDETFDKKKGYASPMRFYQWRLTKSELQREFEINGFRGVKVEPMYKDHGILGAVKWDLHINPDSRIGAALRMLLRPFLSRDFIAHMIVGVAQKV